MARQSYVKNAAILTATSLILRAAGMLFRIYIAGRIGAEGMGLHQLITTVYTMATTFATGGLSVAATRLCAQMMASDTRGGVRRAMRAALALALGMGIAVAAALFFGAHAASDWWLKDERAALSLRILAPSLPFMALSACLRGFFMALRKVGPNARAQLFEQAVRIAVVALCLDSASPYGAGAACAAVVLGNTVSEAASWVYMEICWRRALRGLESEQETGHSRASPRPSGGEMHGNHHRGLTRKLLAIVAPIWGSGALTGVLRAIENVMVPTCLTLYLQDRTAALGAYGALKGMAMPVIFFPFSFLATLSTLLLPEISEAHAQGRRGALRTLVERVLLLTLVLSILAGGLFTQFAKELGLWLYKSEEIGFYLTVLGPLMPLMYLESMVDGVLKGLGEQLSSFRYAAVDSFLRILLIALLVPRLGMKGFLFVMILSNLLTSLLNFARLLRVTEVPVRWMRWLVKPVASFLLAGTACRFILRPLADRFSFPLPVWTVAGALFTALIYALCIFLTGCMSVKDIQRMMPKKRAAENPSKK